MVLENKLRDWSVDRGSPPTPNDLQRLYLDDVLQYVSFFVRPLADAEDVTMAVFHAAFHHLPRMKRLDDPKVWLLGIARRKVADSLRRKYRRREEPLSAAATFQTNHNQFENAALVQELLSELPRDQREALVLKYVNGLSTREIAGILERSEAAANSLLQRARDTFYAKGAPLFLNDQEESNV